MTNTAENNKRIAKNTIALYIRTIITLAIGLYTSRVILNILGVDDFGIYNVVGGVVSMFSIITSSLSQAISRYLTFELGKKDTKKLHSIFCTSINIQLLMSLFIVILTETIGIWFLNNRMNIAPERMYAANWVFQFSIFSFVVTLISVPYNAAIIAHEKMKAFAYISILEALLKLAIVIGLYFSHIDKLITYACLLFVVSIIIRMTYNIYCKRNFEECHYKILIDKKLLKDMSKFAGWNFIASAIYILNTQGINIISNIFFGVGVNAARGITTQVESITKSFVTNFTTAVKPQIVKSYSSKDYNYMTKLICTSTKFSYYLMLFFALPFIFETEIILKLWLKIYPEDTIDFIRLTMIISLVGLLGELLYTNILATGKLKKYMIIEAGITCAIFSLSYLLFYNGFSANSSYILFIIIYFSLIIVRLYYLRNVENFPINEYIIKVIFPAIKTTVTAIIIPIVLKLVMPNNSIISASIIITACTCSICCSVYFFGLNREEQELISKRIKNFCNNLKK